MAFVWITCAIKIVVIACILFPQSYATIQVLSTQFTAGKRVATSHTTITSVSKIQCVEKCIRADRENNMCNSAGYNKNTRSCQLSLDQQQDVVNDTDPSFGVFFMNPGIGFELSFQIRSDVGFQTHELKGSKYIKLNEMMH